MKLPSAIVSGAEFMADMSPTARLVPLSLSLPRPFRVKRAAPPFTSTALNFLTSTAFRVRVQGEENLKGSLQDTKQPSELDSLSLCLIPRTFRTRSSIF